MPEFWQCATPKDKKNAIAEYEKSLMVAPARIAPMLEHTLGILKKDRDFDEFQEFPRREDDDSEQSEHRPKSMDFEQPFPCCIARKSGRREFSSEPKAIDAMDREWKT